MNLNPDSLNPDLDPIVEYALNLRPVMLGAYLKFVRKHYYLKLVDGCFGCVEVELWIMFIR